MTWKSGRKTFHTIYTLDTGEKKYWRTGLQDRIRKGNTLVSFDGNYAVIVVGPPPMMKFTGLELLKNDVTPENIWMSFERKMSCAVGKCGHCRIDEVYVCLDGPVFPLYGCPQSGWTEKEWKTMNQDIDIKKVRLNCFRQSKVPGEFQLQMRARRDGSMRSTSSTVELHRQHLG